jgi:hypothetical protein
MDDQVVDTAMAQSLQADALREHGLFAWVIMRDDPAYPGRYTAGLTTSGPLPYVLIGDSLAAVQEQLPADLERVSRQPMHPPEVVEMWVPSRTAF